MKIIDIISTGLRVLALAGLGVSVLLVATGQLWINALGGISPISVGAICGLYLLMEMRLERNGVAHDQSIILAVLFANVFAQSFEVIYHFTFPVYFNYFKFPFLNEDTVRYIGLESTMLLPILLVWKHIRFGIVSALLLLSFAVTWAAWILYGFPQYFTQQSYYPVLFLTNDPYHLSLLLNFGSKVILALFFASLVTGQTKENKRYRDQTKARPSNERRLEVS
jgi:hypothetical protein